MELPFEKTVCRYWKQKLYELRGSEQTQELRIPEGMPDVQRVISAWGQVVLRGKQWRDRSIGIHGGIMVWVLYQPEGEEGLQRLESWIPFQEKLDVPPSEQDGAIRVQTVLRSVDARVLSSRKLMLRCGLGLLVQALVPATASLGVPSQLPEDVELLRNRYPTMLVRETGEKIFQLDEILEIPGTLNPIERIVYYQLEPELLDQKVMGSRGVFRGVGNLHVLYWNQDGRLCVYDFQIPFAQYMELDQDYSDGAMISNLLCVTSAELDVREDGTLSLRCGLVSQYTVQDRSVLDLIEDAYSPCRDVDVQYEALSLPAILDSRMHTLQLSGVLSTDGYPVADISFQPGAGEIYREGDGVRVVANGNFSALMGDDTGIWQFSQKNAENQMIQNANPMSDTICFSWRKGAVTSYKEGNDWRVDTQVVLDLETVTNRDINVVTGIRLGERKDLSEDRPSVILRAVGRGESLWEIAKRFGSTVGAIKRINSFDEEPEEDEVILIPVL